MQSYTEKCNEKQLVIYAPLAVTIWRKLKRRQELLRMPHVRLRLRPTLGVGGRALLVVFQKPVPCHPTKLPF